jgi:hypothetical protein
MPAYTLGELARTLSVASNSEVYVDTRVKDRLLLIQLPEATRLSANNLLIAMSKTTRLRWRKVDSVLFLTLHEEGALRKFGAAKRDALQKTKESILKSVIGNFGDLPIDVGILTRGEHRQWNDLKKDERDSMFSLFSRAERFDSEDNFQQSDLRNGSYFFTLDFQLKISESGSSRTSGISILR